MVLETHLVLWNCWNQVLAGTLLVFDEYQKF